MNEFVISMPLIKDLSVNHYRGRSRYGGEYVKKPIKEWKETLGWLIKECELKGDTRIVEWKLPIKVKVDIVQTDNKTRDAHNYLKVPCDAIEDYSGINDTNYETEAGVPTHGEYAELILTIKEAE